MKFNFACLWANRGTKNVPLRLSLELVVVGDYDITHTHSDGPQDSHLCFKRSLELARHS
jgi:hypothetical protein